LGAKRLTVCHTATAYIIIISPICMPITVVLRVNSKTIIGLQSAIAHKNRDLNYATARA